MADQVEEIAPTSPARRASDQLGSPTSQVAHPSREGLDQQLREIKDNVLRMGAMVEDQIRATLKALIAHNAEAATRVILDDAPSTTPSAT